MNFTIFDLITCGIVFCILGTIVGMLAMKWSLKRRGLLQEEARA